ncbi:MAG: hypothetical protein SH848_20030 [Saprospiraceae bacterium]|nr:hypothetical protein [Saprospiraceae bacterium]MDZ4706228.1 hypothetical protein [Saprospiraceae bacterium]
MDDATYHAIERYLLGQMSGTERAAFESRLAEDSALASQFASQQHEHAALQVLVEDRVRAKLRDWQKQHPIQDAFLRRYRVLFGIAGMMLVIAVLWMILPFGQDKEPDAPKTSRQPDEQPIAETAPPVLPADTPAVLSPSPKSAPKISGQTRKYLAIAADFSEPALFPTGNLRGNDTLRDVLDSALFDLHERRFAQGLTRLRTISAESPRYLDAQYYQGLAHYEQGTFGKAIRFLKTVADRPDYLYAEQAEWRLVLAYLQSGQPKTSQANARKIADDDGHACQEKARKFLKRMSDPKGG